MRRSERPLELEAVDRRPRQCGARPRWPAQAPLDTHAGIADLRALGSERCSSVLDLKHGRSTAQGLAAILILVPERFVFCGRNIYNSAAR